MRVAKWGNSLAVRLPVALVQELGISNGDELLLQPAKHKASQPARVGSPGHWSNCWLRAPSAHHGRQTLHLTATTQTPDENLYRHECDHLMR
jgi:antitoxin MazE